jgi:Zn-finger nucleic acid-binding protein
MDSPDTMDSLQNQRIPAQREGHTLFCPKCKAPLYIAYAHDIEVDYCAQCKGVWVDPVHEKDLLNMQPEVFTLDELKRLRKLYQPLLKVDKSGYVPCPICKELMTRRNWGSYSGVIVDRCEEHGTWYDAGELEKIREFIKLGGVEYEKYKVTNQALDELDQKLVREVHRLDQQTSSSYRRARFYSILGL